jgi:uncharacterized protein YbjT (DUF2867 family)
MLIINISAGSQIFRSAIADPSIASITILSRRALPATSPTSPKATTVVLSDFLSYPASLLPTLAEQDACVWALGTSSVGLSEEVYTEITYHYLVKAVEAIQEARKQAGVDKEFQFVYISGEGADQSGKSMQMFGRVKGRAEKYLIDLPPSSNIKPSIMRPAYFFPGKEDAHIRSSTARFLDKIATPVFSTIAKGLYTPVEGLAQVALGLAKGQWDNDEDRVFRNARIRKLLKEQTDCGSKKGEETASKPS